MTNYFAKHRIVPQLRLAMALLVACLATGCAVSQQREVDMGRDYSQQVDAQLPIVRDTEINRYISVLGDSIARVADNRNLVWHFKVVNSSEVNAFALPGGFVYINRGLIERATNMSMVAGVLGHEIGHVTNRHAIQQMQKAQGANLGLIGVCVLAPSACQGVGGAGLQIGAGAVFASFSRSDENESDAVAVEYLVRAGIDPSGIPSMFRVLIEERRSRPGSVEGFFATHPLAEDRIESTQALIAKYDPAILRTLTKDSPRFQEFKRRVQSLPAGR